MKGTKRGGVVPNRTALVSSWEPAEPGEPGEELGGGGLGSGERGAGSVAFVRRGEALAGLDAGLGQCQGPALRARGGSGGSTRGLTQPEFFF